MAYQIIQVSQETPTQLEQLGTKAKFWFHDQNGDLNLFKMGRPGTGENWAEKVCCEISRLLCLPHAEYNLAQCGDKKGVVTNCFVPKFGRLVFGNELLAGFKKDVNQANLFQAKSHTLRRVMSITSSPSLNFPMRWAVPPAFADCSEVFVGYLLLDALVGNQDRHDENWGLIVMPHEGKLYFAPTYDHASSLGRNETDENRIDRLNTRDAGRSVEAYSARASSRLYLHSSSQQTLKTIDAFEEAKNIRQNAAAYWLNKLAAIEDNRFLEILNCIPDTEITEPARQFAFKMLVINKQRILNLI
jgi:hypothetical protein